jgi:hypothetical protein
MEPDMAIPVGCSVDVAVDDFLGSVSRAVIHDDDLNEFVGVGLGFKARDASINIHLLVVGRDDYRNFRQLGVWELWEWLYKVSVSPNRNRVNEILEDINH